MKLLHLKLALYCRPSKKSAALMLLTGKMQTIKSTAKRMGRILSKTKLCNFNKWFIASAHNIKDNDYVDTTSVDNIFNKLNSLGKMAKSYISTKIRFQTANSGDQKGSYHDPMRFYSNLGGQSASTSTYCNTHDVPANNF